MVLSMCVPLHLDDGVAQTNIMECLSVIMSGQTDLWLTVRGMSSILLMVVESPQRATYSNSTCIYTYSRSVNGHMAIILTIC